MRIRYAKGDATRPEGEGPKVIVHVCNDEGKWGAGFVRALSMRWREPERRYRAWFASKEPPSLGSVQFVPVSEDVTVANLIGQRGVRRSRRGVPPIRYEAIEEGLRAVAEHAAARGASIHMPRIGCGLAGGRWEKVEPLIERLLAARGLPVWVYDLPETSP